MNPVLRTLTDGLIDYAGLFPPAALEMEQAVRNYDIYKHGEHRRMLGRFIVPAQRLAEFERAASVRLDEDPDPWHLSLLGSGEASADAELLGSFNSRHGGGALIDAVETRWPESGDIDSLRGTFRDITLYVEVPHDSPDTGDRIESLRRAGVRAKIRTGGVTPDAFPDAAAVVDFISACVDRRVPLKATAGLHHPLRCRAPLTYETDSPTGLMHGFVNLFLAAAFLYERHPREDVVGLLSEQDPEAFRFRDDSIYWRDHEVLASVLAEVRRTVVISFGSCSFEEPVNDLRALGWIRRHEMEQTTT